jgi:hypothetical protein
MQLTVYVGPYIETHRCEIIRDLVWTHEEQVFDGRGELGVDEAKMYIVPNGPLPSVSRQMRFSRDDEMPVVYISQSDRDQEMEAFRILAKPFIDKLNKMRADYFVLWGVVCRYS